MSPLKVLSNENAIDLTLGNHDNIDYRQPTPASTGTATQPALRHGVGSETHPAQFQCPRYRHRSPCLPLLLLLEGNAPSLKPNILNGPERSKPREEVPEGYMWGRHAMTIQDCLAQCRADAADLQRRAQLKNQALRQKRADDKAAKERLIAFLNLANSIHTSKISNETRVNPPSQDKIERAVEDFRRLFWREINVVEMCYCIDTLRRAAKKAVMLECDATAC
ncbi:hypothetical protein B0H63DRAFT_489921 [Podospora didyma]|uniref:Uncharacterized protein n=1 Tax=Podospora didyma TaxID=330526 RepID=A0AAE0N225_9PEZI|nr:hypothetical protein B0H63DRAFT_489921 [Podospora didyma]